MKKTTLLLAAAWMLLLWFVPQSAKADVDYLREPFTIETTTGSSGTYYIRFYNSSLYSANYTVTINLDYRLKEATDENFGDWTTVATANTTTAKGLYDNSISLAAGKTYIIQFRGINSTGFSKESGITSWAGFLSKKDNYQILPQSSTSDWNVTMYGNIMSLIVGYDTDNEVTAKNTLASENTIPNNYCFTSLFYMHQSYYTDNNASSNISPANYAIIDASNLIFPATILKTGCYMNLFNNTYSQANGVKYGPTFLVTDLNNAANSGVTDAFRSMFWGCNQLQSVRLNLTTCPTQTDNFGSFIYSSSSTGKMLYCPSGFSSCSTCYNSGAGDTSYQWNTSAWSYDPSAEPGGGDEPGGGVTSDPAEVDVYQAATADTTKIVYDYPATITGDDNKRYGLVDMGYGVIWADRNVGASAANGLGDYYNYGGIEPIEAGAACTYLEIVSSMNAGDILPDDAETAKVIMGSNWHMPTKAEWQSLLDNTTYSGTVFTSKSDNKTLILPTGGFYGEDYYDQFVLQATTNGYYWSSEFTSANYDSYYYGYAFSNAVIFSKEGDNYIVDNQGYVLYGAQVRAIYEPSFTTYTLTIHAGDQTYTYVCEDGQSVTVTAHADKNAEYKQVFKWWSDDHSNTNAERTFTVDDDIEVTAVFTLDPSVPQHTATFVNYDGTQLYQVNVAIGAMPVYAGSTPTKTDWFFNGWSPAISVMGDADVVYTATFRDLESAPANVNIYQGMTADTMKILYNLDPKTGADGKTYIPVDMGYGVAWADRNVGATSTTNVGTYFAWSDTNPNRSWPSNGSLYGPINQGSSTFVNGYTLTSTYDAAYQNMGPTWRMPTNTEWSDFLANTTVAADGGTFKNKIDNTKSIFLPASGYYIRQSLDQSTYRYYWSSKMYKGTLKVGYSNTTVNGAYALQNYGGTYYVDWYDHSGGTTNNAKYNYELSTQYYGMPVRAIYVPSYSTCTLTVNVGTKKYRYICQSGQEVTVTANATVAGQVFDKWTEDNNTNATRTFTVTGNVAYTATFKEAPSVSTYTVHFLAGEGSGTMSDQEINVGEPTNLNANTFTAPTATITYDYQGATGGNSKETDVVTAEFDSWYDEDSETSYNDEDEVTDLAAADETVTLTAQWMYNTITLPTPTKTGYTFAGWEDEDGGSHDGDEMFFPEKSQTFTATWTKATTLDLYDNRNAAYYNNIKDLNGKTYDVTYHRSVKYESDNGNARWYTLCLPFDVDQSQLDLNGLTGKVYEYRYAEGSADENDHVTFHFRAVKSPNYMHAGQGYLVKATSTMPSEYTFANVTLNTATDVADGDVNDLKETNAYKESGEIAIVGVLRNGTLSAVGKQVMGLANNKIWYPHSSGNPMPAYRAYFYNPNASASVMPRVRIEVEGEGTTELEVVDGELYDARGNNAGGDVRAPSGAASKYIRNGVLIIERNGVTYDAQGKRL